MTVKKPTPPAKKRVFIYFFSRVKPPKKIVSNIIEKMGIKSQGNHPHVSYIEIDYDDQRHVPRIVNTLLRKPHSIAIVAASPRVLAKLLETARKHGVAGRIYVPVLDIAYWPVEERDGWVKYCIRGSCYAIRLVGLYPLEKAAEAVAQPA